MTAAEDDLLPDYERELSLLRRSLGEFAQRYPKAATRLAISGEHSEDAHVERLIQSAALLNARASARLDDDFSELPTALLEILYPEYLRPFPSCSIAHFEDADVIEKMVEPTTIERGIELKTRTGGYCFRTVYDVVLAPLRIAAAGFAPATSAPPKVRLHEATTGIVSITFAALGENAIDGSSMPERVRIFVDGDCRTVAATIDTILLRTSNAFVEADGSGAWIALDSLPLSCVGFDNDEAMIEQHDSHESQFRILLEYFSFPEKFDFIDVDLSTLVRVAGACNRVTLHLSIKDLHRDSAPAQVLQRLSGANFKLFCAPIINLFALPSVPIPLENAVFAVYPIMPGALSVSNTSVYRVDAVRLTQASPNGTVIRQIEPYQSLSHPMTQQRSAIYWLAERDGRLAEFVPGQDMLLSLVDSSGEMTDVTGERIEMDLTCTNGNSPARLQVGDSQGDWVHANAKLTGRVSMLSLPTESIERSKARHSLWDIVAMLSAGALNLCQAGLPAFKQLLKAHVPLRSTTATRHIDSLTYLARESALEWIQMEPQPMLVRGIRVRLAVDETMLGDCAVSVFARVLESVFQHYAPANSWVQLVLISARNGAEMIRGRPLPGAIALL
ncbi:type VI secretion system baseplate subunit TssF [Trinickia acidisoli]|uniref:type VI secretion system baseplate subunit TssF n=1 Tax=Trinickia acidisoli TaxID=2767482 RepID=UPI001A903AC0|nr:type VI secretion system baseplate subunit TssF [Trinickia acidisoli]